MNQALPADQCNGGSFYPLSPSVCTSSHVSISPENPYGCGSFVFINLFKFFKKKTNLPQQAEEHFSACSSIFNTKSNYGKQLPGQIKSNLRFKASQLPLKTDKESTSIGNFNPFNAQKCTKLPKFH